MKQKKLYLSPESDGMTLLHEIPLCTSYTGPETTYTGEVNDFATIEEVDISSLWN